MHWLHPEVPSYLFSFCDSDNHQIVLPIMGHVRSDNNILCLEEHLWLSSL